MKQGDEIKITAVIDACRTGLKKQEYRIRIGDNLVWIPAELVDKNED